MMELGVEDVSTDARDACLVNEADMNQDEDDSSQRAEKAKKVKMDMKAMRRERRVKSGADIVVKNVLPFLKLG